MIDYNKPVQTKNGTPVEILTTNMMGPHPVLGKLNKDTHKGNHYCTWDYAGRCVYDSDRNKYDLENVPMKKELWVNVYKDIDHCIHDSRKKADRKAALGRIARVKIVAVEGRFD